MQSWISEYFMKNQPGANKVEVVTKAIRLAWSRQNSRVPLKRTTSGVPVSFAFFFPWPSVAQVSRSWFMMVMHFYRAADVIGAFFPILHLKNLRHQVVQVKTTNKTTGWWHYISTEGSLSRMEKEHTHHCIKMCWKTSQGIKRLAHCHRLSQEWQWTEKRELNKQISSGSCPTQYTMLIQHIQHSTTSCISYEPSIHLAAIFQLQHKCNQILWPRIAKRSQRWPCNSNRFQWTDRIMFSEKLHALRTRLPEREHLFVVLRSHLASCAKRSNIILVSSMGGLIWTCIQKLEDSSMFWCFSSLCHKVFDTPAP